MKKIPLYIHLDEQTDDKLKDLIKIRKSKSKKDCLIELINISFDREVNKIMAPKLTSEYEEEE